jgi:hypothetical protein
VVWRLGDKGRSSLSKENMNKVERAVGMARFTVKADGKKQKPGA